MTLDRPRRNMMIGDVFEHGRVQPQAVDLEEAILGAIMLEKEALLQVISILKPDMFYKDQHKVIYQAILALYTRSEAIDIMTVTQYLKISGDLEEAGGGYYITQLTNRVASSANIEYHAWIVIEMYVYREIIRTSSEAIQHAFETGEDGAQDLLNTITMDFIQINNNFQKENASSIDELVDANQKTVANLMDKTTAMIGISSGIDNFDMLTLGFQKSDLIILAGRPGMGKTALVVTWIKKMGMANIPVGFMSLEMAKQQVSFRLESQVTGFPYNKIRGGFLTNVEILHYLALSNKLRTAPIYIDDQARVNVIEMRAKASSLKKMYNIEILFIDYIQLMSGVKTKGQNREQEIASISRELKILAKELNIPVIAISQLSRAVEVRGGKKRPQLQDLRESGAIEQDADLVVFVYRPEYYGILEDENGKSLKGYAEIIVEKHRNGKTGIAPCRFDANRMEFVNAEGSASADISGKLFEDDEGNIATTIQKDEDEPF